ncbi:Ppx/GppA phosphatase family protein [Notoacmeibacter sp. MSK16QG-6]|uniref:Ppx/GppA phosphatase family protein n=1 Tax=Notoacmeibacter sp. MSK16QG-6 TaxID=2957982 RepID=UPI00209E208F|nr:Ppx/GppA phosphatase family protein [Notoacmeibacter sp. MSK16QG-6]MCP1198479.1 Ppx/GppA family phosphatase [Notoacmeibacter sp. MSK16QG-6]
MRLQSQGRLPGRDPVAIVDIGSNSVRLVIFEGVTRAPTLFFNEKMLAGLGRSLVDTGRLNTEGVEAALQSFSRFRALAEQAGATEIHVIATAAAREAENGEEFIAEAQKRLGTEIRVLSGREEAYYAALAVKAHFYKPAGIAGDLGGGSLELIRVNGDHPEQGITLPLGGLRLSDVTDGDPQKAGAVAAEELKRASFLREAEGADFFAVGGTWRNLARLHMSTIDYPLSVLHEYAIDARAPATIKFLETVAAGDLDRFDGIGDVSKNRRSLLPYGAAVLLAIIDAMKPARIVTSGVGVREGYLFSLLDEEDRQEDPLLVGAREMAILRARSVKHAEELADWTDMAFAEFGLDETEDEQRLRRATCLIADLGWRAHPDYRGMQSMNVIAYSALTAIGHGGRAFLSLANFYRYNGVKDEGWSTELLKLMDERMIHRARTMGLLMRVLYVLSASMPGVLPRLTIRTDDDGTIEIAIPAALSALHGVRPSNRLAKLSKYLDRPMRLVVN